MPRCGRGFVCAALILLQVSHNACSSLLTQPSLHKRSILRAQGAARPSSAVVTGSTLSPVANAHWKHAGETLQSLQVSELVGLSTEDAIQRLLRYGPNALPEPSRQSLLRLVLDQFADRLVQVLVGVAVLSSILAAMEQDKHAFSEPLTIIAILIVNAFVGVWQSRSAEDSLQALKKLQPNTCVVLRDGEWKNDFPAEQLVPGDILSLRVGDRVPADARLISLKSSAFSANEASLTGESESSSKSLEPVEAGASITDKHCMVFGGTLITAGSALAVVTATGAASEMGAISAGVQQAHALGTRTPLSEQLDRFGSQLGSLVAIVCAAIWMASIPKFKSPVFASPWHGAAHFAKAAVALGVAAVPEGLPAVITLCLSLGTRKLAEHNVIVRKLPSVETLGCTSVICTDKTGTLTTGQMTATSLTTFPAGQPRERSVHGQGYSPQGSIEGLDLQGSDVASSLALRFVALTCALCNEARLVYKEDTQSFDHTGEPTEAALQALGEKLGFQGIHRESSPSLLASQSLAHWQRQYETLAVQEFSRDRKSMSVLLRRRPAKSAMGMGAEKEREGGENVLVVKGAAEMVLERCSHVMAEDGSLLPLDSALRSTIHHHIQQLARRPLRCLALAVKTGRTLGPAIQAIRTSVEAAASPSLHPSQHEALETDLTLVGLAGIQDPARPEVRQAIQTCKEAGVRVMMITGDGRETATAIARDVDILHGPDADRDVFVSADFFRLPLAVQTEALRKGNKVFCRAEPRDKQRLIAALEALGEVPAMTGDGVNDAPALQQAAIGIAMGRTGTEVAKAASDMVLADDNFASIVRAIREGRSIFTNLQSFICFLVSCNLGEVAVVAAAALLGLPEPLTPLHLLWVNLVTDGPPATALGFNPSDPQAMQRPPRGRNEPLLSRWLLARYALTGAYVGLATLGAFTWWFLDKGVTWDQLRHWPDCRQWTRFAHSALAPHWPEQPCEIFASGLLRAPRSMALSTLVVIEMLKALSAVSLDQSGLRVPFWKNRALFPAVLGAILVHLAALYVPRLSTLFGLHPLSGREWKVVLAFSAPVLLVEELLKAVGRNLAARKAAAAAARDPSMPQI